MPHTGDRRDALVAALPDLLRLPPLGQIGRRKYGSFLRALCDLFEADGATLGLWVSPEQVRRFRVRRGEGGEEVYEDASDPGRVEGTVGRILREGNAVLIPRAHDGRPVQPEGGDYPGRDSTTCLLVGVRVRDEPPALVALHRFSEESFTESDRELIQALGPLLGTAVDNLRRFHRAEELSITDGLTGVYNYRYLRSALDKEVSRARRFGETFSIIMLDVDHLKEYNDVHGHLRGSEVLRRLAQIVMDKLREADVVAKYGGDEFVIILPQTEREGALILADRIREAIERHEFPGETGSIAITSSLGIAVFPADGRNARDLLDASDAALYCAKRGGRNRVSPTRDAVESSGPEG